MRLAGLLGANLLIAASGVGVLTLLGAARSWRELVARSGLAYLCGIVFVGILSAQLGLVRLSFGWIGLLVVTASSIAVAVWRLRGTARPAWSRPSWFDLAGFAALAALVVEYGRAFRVAPLDRYDAWAIWALKGHALYSFGWADPAVFAGEAYRFANLDYPILLPSLEAIDFRSMGAFETRLLHLQFLLLLVAGLLAIFALLRDRVPPLLLWLALFATALAPALFDQLLTAYADVPLALIFAVGVAAAGRWLATDERWALALAALCFAGALLTKNEGSLFVASVFLALVVVAHRRWRALLVAAGADVLVLLPWKIYVRIYDLKDINYRFGDTFDYDHISGRLGVARIAFRTLGAQLVDPGQWGFLVPIFAAIVVAALFRGVRALPLFAVVWIVVSWCGLSWIYVISHFEYSAYLASTKERVVASIVLGSAALLPLIGGEVWATRGRDRPRSGAG